MKTHNRKLPVTYIFLGIVMILGIGLRFYRLTTVPPSLSHDETAIAYNAYSLLATGKDEYGERLPLLFRSFDDYKLPGMVYSTIPFAALFGRNELTARLPSAVYGTLSILVLYFLVLELFKAPNTRHQASSTKYQAPNKHQKTNSNRLKIWNFDIARLPARQVWNLGFGAWNFAEEVALLSALFLAIQPWHINFSRQLFESNGAVFWFLLGTLFLVRSTRKYPYILVAALSYVLALYFYYSVRLIIPFVVLLYVIMHARTIIKHRKYSLLAGALGLAAFLPLGIQMLSPGGLERISIVSVSNDPNYISRKETYTAIIAGNPTVLNKIIYNRRLALAQTVIENYGKNISPQNLFISGTGTYGALYPFDAIFVIAGLYALLSLKPFPALLVCMWLLTAFLPGAFSTKQPNTLRTLAAAPAFAVLSGSGAAYLARYIRQSRRYRYIIVAVFALIAIMFSREFSRFLYAYFTDNPQNNAVSFADGNKQMVQYVTEYQRQYNRVYVSGYYWRPYIFMLYWGGIDPSVYQASGTPDRIGKYYFSSAGWDTSGMRFMDPDFDFRTLPEAQSALFIVSKQEYELHRDTLEKIRDLDGRIAPSVFISARLSP